LFVASCGGLEYVVFRASTSSIKAENVFSPEPGSNVSARYLFRLLYQSAQSPDSRDYFLWSFARRPPSLSRRCNRQARFDYFVSLDSLLRFRIPLIYKTVVSRDSLSLLETLKGDSERLGLGGSVAALSQLRDQLERITGCLGQQAVKVMGESSPGRRLVFSGTNGAHCDSYFLKSRRDLGSESSRHRIHRTYP
jgi:hypothetical protein